MLIDQAQKLLQKSKKLQEVHGVVSWINMSNKGGMYGRPKTVSF